MPWANWFRSVTLAAALTTIVGVAILAGVQLRSDLDLAASANRGAAASSTPSPSYDVTSSPTPSPSSSPTPGPADESASGDATDGEEPSPLTRLVERVREIPARPAPPGYERDCSPGDGCVFGPAWSDDNEVELGHNGCDTRNDVLARDLRDVVLEPGTNDCVVLSGQFVEPYTGQPVEFVRGGTDIQIDHVVPLALAWDLGADTWSPQRRVDFANDPRNLLAVDGPTNQSKGDQGPATWLPLNAGFRCRYVALFADVLLAYDLPLPSADLASMRATAEGCDAA